MNESPTRRSGAQLLREGLASVLTKPGLICADRARHLRLMGHDPNSGVNKSGFEKSFADGITFRGSVEFPVTIAARSGHQGFVALYSTMDGTDLDDLGEISLPAPSPGTVGIKNHRFYFAYTVDQYLYQSQENPDLERLHFPESSKSH